MEQREVVFEYIVAAMREQGASLSGAVDRAGHVYFFGMTDTENLYKCINSGLPEETKRAIVAHDFNGLASHDECFVPKSSQFADKELV
jgi:hypothetical protein